MVKCEDCEKVQRGLYGNGLYYRKFVATLPNGLEFSMIWCKKCYENNQEFCDEIFKNRLHKNRLLFEGIREHGSAIYRKKKERELKMKLLFVDYFIPIVLVWFLCFFAILMLIKKIT